MEQTFTRCSPALVVKQGQRGRLQVHQIASHVTNARGTPEIWIRSVEEGWARPVVKRDSEGSVSWQSLGRPSFSPDGQRIVYEVIGTKHTVWVASVADGRGVPLDQESPDQHSPAWSPDGNWVAYQRLQDGKWELVKVALGGGKPVRLADATPGGGDITAWSPSGEWIAHVVGETLRLTSADGQTQKTLSGSPPAAFGFSLDAASLYRGSTCHERDVGARRVRCSQWAGTQGSRSAFAAQGDPFRVQLASKR